MIRSYCASCSAERVIAGPLYACSTSNSRLSKAMMGFYGGMVIRDVVVARAETNFVSGIFTSRINLIPPSERGG